MVSIEVDGRNIQARKGETLLEALRRAGVHVPTLCHMDGFTPSGACRLCVVEVEGARSLVPSCATPVAEGMRVRTHSERVIRARKTIVELLLASHPDDCLYCVRNGDCALQELARSLGIERRRFYGQVRHLPLDVSSPAIVREPDKCVLCGRCVRVCEEVQTVSAIDFVGRGWTTRVSEAFEEGLNVSSCVFCGQCIQVCPTGALHERGSVEQVLAALGDPDSFVVVQHAPAVGVTIGEVMGLPKGRDCTGVLNAALRRLGFDLVFDTAWGADLTVMEEASELVARIRGGGVLPMMTSCSPAWIKFLEQFFPHRLDHLSTCKSPQEMLGAMVKHFFAPRHHVEPARVVNVAVMPCTAKKFEASRPELGTGGMADVDLVLTTRELAELIVCHGLDMRSMEPEPADDPFGNRSGAGKIFGVTGGVAEAAMRTAHHLITGEELPGLELQAVRGLEGRKEARVRIGDLELGVAVVSGLGQARALMEELDAGRDDLHFIEVMSCPGGCINGGGQPRNLDKAALARRMAALYQADRDEAVRTSHANPTVARIYRELLGEPLGPRSHELLHTSYQAREVLG